MHCSAELSHGAVGALDAEDRRCYSTLLSCFRHPLHGDAVLHGVRCHANRLIRRADACTQTVINICHGGRPHDVRPSQDLCGHDESHMTYRIILM